MTSSVLAWLLVFFVVNFGLAFLLAMNVSRIRIRKNISNGHGNDLELKKAIRAHANALEHTVPFGLLLLVAALSGSGSATLAVLTIAFSLARFSHAYGMLTVGFQARRIGAAVTYLFEIAVLLVLCVNAFSL